MATSWVARPAAATDEDYEGALVARAGQDNVVLQTVVYASNEQEARQAAAPILGIPAAAISVEWLGSPG